MFTLICKWWVWWCCNAHGTAALYRAASLVQGQPFDSLHKQNSLSDISDIVVMQASGWGIVIGFGAFFALFAGSLVYLDIAFSGEVCSAPCLSHC